MINYYPEGKNRLVNSELTKADIERMIASKGIFEGYVEKVTPETSLIVNLHPFKGIIYFSDLELGFNGSRTKEVAATSKITKRVSFVVEEIQADGLVRLNRRQAQQMCYNDYLSTVELGTVIEANITLVAKFAAFCDVGCGVVAMLPVENINTSRIEDLTDELKDVKQLYVVVSNRDCYGRLVLSHKELLGTWEELIQGFEVGETVIGVVRKVESYGTFVELVPNLDTLTDKTERYVVGDRVSITIKKIDATKMKIKSIVHSKVEHNAVKTGVYKYTQTSGRVKEWKYSPACCAVRIERIYT